MTQPKPKKRKVAVWVVTVKGFLEKWDWWPSSLTPEVRRDLLALIRAEKLKIANECRKRQARRGKGK